MWGDDGAETDYLMAVDRLTLFSEACWKGEGFTVEEADRLADHGLQAVRSDDRLTPGFSAPEEPSPLHPENGRAVEDHASVHGFCVPVDVDLVRVRDRPQDRHVDVSPDGDVREFEVREVPFEIEISPDVLGRVPDKILCVRNRIFDKTSDVVKS